MLDMRSDLERKVLKIIEENPKRILQHIRMIEEKETNLWAQNFDRHNQNSDSIQLLK